MFFYTFINLSTYNVDITFQARNI